MILRGMLRHYHDNVHEVFKYHTMSGPWLMGTKYGSRGELLATL